MTDTEMCSFTETFGGERKNTFHFPFLLWTDTLFRLSYLRVILTYREGVSILCFSVSS